MRIGISGRWDENNVFSECLWVSCPPNVGSEQIVMNTGFSDRALPGIPNKFVQQGGADYPTVIEAQQGKIVVRNSKKGFTYDLSYYAGNHVESKTGTGGDIVFNSTRGVFRVSESNNGVETGLMRHVNIADPILFTAFPHLVYDGPVIEFTEEENYSKTVTFRKEIDFDVSVLEEWLELIEYDYIRYEYMGMTDSTCTIRITPPFMHFFPDSPSEWRSLFWLFTPDPEGAFGHSYLPFVAPDPKLSRFEVTGEWNDARHTSFDVNVSGSQYGVSYRLVAEGLFSSISLPNITLEGTGGPLVFENISAKGVYKVVAEAAGMSADMNGRARMYESAELYGAGDNWTKTRTYRIPGGTPNENVTYYDGLGRPVQRVGVKAGGNGNDIVQLVSYDKMGRDDTKVYLPFSRPTQGAVRSLYGIGEQNVYYGAKFPGERPYAEKQYDGTKVTAYGVGDSGQGNPVLSESRTNTVVDSIKKYAVGADGASLYYAGQYYAAGILSVRKTSTPKLPADQRTESYTYTDSFGQVVAEETRAGDDRRITYYVHDGMGRQRYVVPDILDRAISDHGGVRAVDVRKYGYYNEYDDHGRVVAQCVPGADTVRTIYDARGRVAMTQDGVQREANRWSFVKYDRLDRPVMTGVMTGGSLETHRNTLARQSVFGEERGMALHGYTNICYPSAIAAGDILTVTYYDDYQWQEGSDYAFSAADALDAVVERANIKGLATGTKTKVLGVDGDQWLTSATYYNSYYQSIQAVAGLYPQGREIVSNRHNLAGDVLETKVRQTVGGRSYGYSKTFEYDAQGRLLRIRQQMDGAAEMVTVASHSYDDLGKLVGHEIHGGLEATSYTHDIAGRQTEVSSPSFSYSLWFDKAPAGMTGRFDGNLSHVTSQDRGGYTFAYDRFGQMTAATWMGPSMEADGKYAERDIAYDRNGNIEHLLRTDAAGGVLHELDYFYDGNLLIGVGVDGREPEDVFEYDSNGNMVFDGMSGVSISYNLLNLPEEIVCGTEKVCYIYSASGDKLGIRGVDGSLSFYRSVMRRVLEAERSCCGFCIRRGWLRMLAGVGSGGTSSATMLVAFGVCCRCAEVGLLMISGLIIILLGWCTGLWRTFT